MPKKVEHLTKEWKEKIRNSNLGKKLTEETKRKMSLARKGRNISKEHRHKIHLSLKGRHVSLETEFKKGKKYSKEIIRKRSESIKKNAINNPNYGMKGKRHSEETRKKLSISHLGHISWNKGKKGIYSEEVIIKIREARAKQVLPKKDTTIEVKIQNFLEQLGIDYFKHKYMNIEHGYQCDILIPSMNLVIECDGNYWHKYPIGTEIDHIRTKELIEKGFRVLRLWECEIRAMDLNKFQDKLKEK